MKNNFRKILNELSYRVSSGIPDLTNEQHLMKLWDILKEHNWNIDARVELLKNLNEVSIVKNKKSGNVYPVKTFKPQTQTIIKKDATKDDIKKAQQGATEKDFETDKKFDKEKVDRIQKKLYGEDGKGPLLQKSETTQQALDNGYKKGEPWVAPGNAGSNFNENMSNEASLILDKHPDL